MGIENGRRGIVLGVVGGGIALLVDQVIAFLHSLPISEQYHFSGEGGNKGDWIWEILLGQASKGQEIFF